MRHRRRSSKRRITLVGLGIIGGLLIVNIALFAIYHGRTYPRTQLMGTTLGSVSYGSLEDHLATKGLIPKQLSLQHGDTHVQVSATELGIAIDTTPTITSAKDQRPWVPLMALIRPPVLDAPVRIDSQKLANKASELSPKLVTAPKNAQLTLDQGRVEIIPDKPGTSIDLPALQHAVQRDLGLGKTAITVPMRTVAADVQSSDLQDKKRELDKQLTTRINLQYETKTTTPSKADMAGWYERSGDGFVLSADTVARAVLAAGKSFGIHAKDNYHIATEIIKAMQAGTPYSKTLGAATPSKTVTYCTAVRNVSSNELPALKEKAAATLADSRGWSLNGLVAFKEVTSGCNFTLWLSTAEQMPTFGAICDSMWSCRVGPNVVINYDRWQNASPAWNEYGGNLQQYRDMVINHEVGHWLSFGHDHCPGSGQKAPVMQQQSINLQGCTFNPWPTATEQATYRQSIGL